MEKVWTFPRMILNSLVKRWRPQARRKTMSSISTTSATRMFGIKKVTSKDISLKLNTLTWPSRTSRLHLRPQQLQEAMILIQMTTRKNLRKRKTLPPMRMPMHLDAIDRVVVKVVVALRDIQLLSILVHMRENQSHTPRHIHVVVEELTPLVRLILCQHMRSPMPPT